MVSQTLDILKVTSSETGEAILGMLRSLLSLYQIPEWRVLSVTSDHASNMVKAINLSPWNNIGCCAHMVNLAVGEGLDVIGPQVQRLSQCVKSIRKYDFLEVSQGEKYVTISIAFPLLRELHDQLLPNQHSPISTLANSVKVTIRGAIGRRWMLKRELEKHFIRCAIMLDPRIKSIDEGEVVADEFHRKVLQEMSKLKRPQASELRGGEETLTNLLEKILHARPVLPTDQEELTRYLSLDHVALKEDPLEWWKHHQNTFPKLAEMAKKYLGCLATSAPIERLWSVAGRMMAKLRMSMKFETLQHILRISFHMKSPEDVERPKNQPQLVLSASRPSS